MAATWGIVTAGRQRVREGDGHRKAWTGEPGRLPSMGSHRVGHD